MSQKSIIRLPILIIFLFILSFGSAFSASFIIKLKQSGKKKPIEKLLSGAKNIKPVFEFLDKKTKYDRILSAAQSESLQDLALYYQAEFEQNNIADELLQNDDIESITPNYKFKIETDKFNDTFYDSQWALEQIKAVKAWEKASGKGVVIGMVDTGIDFTHPDLVDNIYINEKEDINKTGRFEPWSDKETRNGITGDLNGLDEDGNGFADDVIGYDMIDQETMSVGDWSTPDAVPEDEGRHGTNVAGVMIAKANNHLGVAGLAYSAKLITARAFDATGNGESDDIAASIVYLALRGVKLINFSFGEEVYAPILHSAVKFAYSMGCFMAASSGNANNNNPHFPSDFPEVSSIGGSDQYGKKWGFSNYGSKLALCAPAASIYTTGANSTYESPSGTSLASPYIVACAALLLELNPELTNTDIDGILKATAQNQSGTWTPEMGAGILNCADALEWAGKTQIEFTYPDDYYTFNKSKISSIIIKGSILTPLFDSWSLLIGEQENPTQWTEIASDNKKQIKNDSVAVLDLTSLEDKVYTLRLIVKLKNKNTLESRRTLIIHSDLTPLSLDIKTFDAYKNAKRAVIITGKTNYPVFFSLKYRNKGSVNYIYSNDFFEKSKSLEITLSDEIRSGSLVECIATAYMPGSDTVVKVFEIQKKSDEFSFYGKAVTKPYSLPISYILNKVYNIYGNEDKSFFVNDFSEYFIGKPYIYSYDNGKMMKKDSLDELVQQSWYPIPVGMGNIEGNGTNDIVTYSVDQTQIYSSLNDKGNPFAKKLYSSPISNSLWTEQIADFDGNGIDELLCFDRKKYFSAKYKNGSIEPIQSALTNSPLDNIPVYSGSESADFDGDGKTDVCFADQNGNLRVFKNVNGSFESVFVDTSNFNPNYQYITKADIDGDGIYEILRAYYESADEGRSEYNSQVWVYKLLKYFGNNDYRYIWEERVQGVRFGSVPKLGFNFKSGIAAGNVDKEAGDEIVLTPFPNLYVFKWDKSTNAMRPLWNHPASLSNSVLINDFDANGINEIGFNSFSKMEFWELDTIAANIQVPGELAGESENESTVVLYWNKCQNAQTYTVYYVDLDDPNGKLIPAAVSGDTLIYIQNLEPQKWYRFYCSANINGVESGLSNSVDIFTANHGRIISAETDDNINFTLKFNTLVPRHTISSSYFETTDNNFVQGKYYASSALAGADSTIILSFDKELSSGDYIFKVLPFKDFYGNTIESSQAALQIFPIVKSKEIYLKSLFLYSDTFLQLEFSEAVTAESAESADNYKIKPYGNVYQVSLVPTEPNKVDIFLNPDNRPEARGKDYTITAENILSESGIPITKGAGNTLAFSIASESNEKIIIYPNPIKYSDKPEIYISNITSKAQIEILTLEGSLLRELNENDGNGGVYWDGLDNEGRKLKKGIYLVKVIDKTGRKDYEEYYFGKFAVIE